MCISRNIDSQNGSQEGQFCERCAKIDFQAIFESQKNIPRRNGLPILELGLLQESDNGCSMCQLLAAVRFPKSSDKGRKSGYHLRAFSSLAILDAKMDKQQQPSILLSVVHGGALHEGFLPRERNDFVHSSFIVPAIQAKFQSLPRTIYQGYQVHQTSISYNRIRKWLGHCETSHGESCGLRGTSPPLPLNLIDCFARKVIQKDSVEYLALSYVWGSPNLTASSEEQEDTGHLPSEGVPQVIKDAISVTIALGKQFLWIDKYCVDQKNHEIKSFQIQNMDRIYEGAYATIIACAGSDADFGLPGVGLVSREHQPIAHAGNQALVSTLPSLSSCLKHSVWATRGWTYQEVTLSRRCLFFTKLQVYFVCKAMKCCEAVASRVNDTTENSVNAETIRSADIFDLSRDIPAFEPHTELTSLTDHIEQYTGRELSYQTDAVNAFRGLLRRSRFHSYYGIPIAAQNFPKSNSSVQDLNIGFARGLFWLPRRDVGFRTFFLPRRPEFPSWSWAGWKGRIVYGPFWERFVPKIEVPPVKATQPCSDTRFWIDDDDGTLFPLEYLIDATTGTKLITELSAYLVLEAWVVQFQLQLCSLGEGTVEVCKCHQISMHEGRVDHNSSIGKVTLCQQPSERDNFHQRLITQVWDCIILYVSVSWTHFAHFKYHLMIIEWHGDITQRIGTIEVETKAAEFDRMKKDRRRIWLG